MPGPSSFLGLWRTSAARWLLAYLAIVLVVSATTLGYLFSLTNAALTSQLGEIIATEIRGLQEQFRAGGIELLTRSVEERGRAPGAGLYLVTDNTGRRLAGNLDKLPTALETEPAGALFSYTGPDGDGPASRQAIGIAMVTPGGHRLVVGRDIEAQRLLVDRFRDILIWGLGFILIAGLGGGLVAGRGLLRRVDEVVATSRTIIAGDLRQRIALVGSGDELDRLAENLNVMLDRIEQLVEGLREVSDNIAHDLRTPLTRLRHRVETALREAGGAPAYRAALEETVEEADALIATFNALLSIARLEAGTGRERMVALDLADVVRDAAELYEPVAEERGFALSIETPTGVVVEADRGLLGQALANLLDNAIKYGNGSAGRSIALTLRRHDATAEIAVADRGQGVPAAERDRVLRRFVRLDSSRSQPGTGLGLSLVAAIVRLHGGELRLEDNAPGLRVVIALPLWRDHNA